MTRTPNRSDHPSTQLRETERWQRQIQNSLPLVGSWLRLEAARLLGQAARQGSPQATLVLALAYANSPDERVRQMAREAIEVTQNADCMNAIWTAWIETRSSVILQLLLEKNWVASAPPRARVYSALRLERPDLLIQGGPEIVAPLIDACQDANTSLAAQASECLLNLQNQASIDTLCERWTRERGELLEGIIAQAGYLAAQPPLARVLTAILNDRSEIAQAVSPDLAPALIQACHDPNPALAKRAVTYLGELSRADSIDTICGMWVEKRLAWLGDVITRCGYVAEQPPGMRALSALKASRFDVLENLGPECIPALLEACQDGDPAVRKNALPALRQLKSGAAQEALCLQAIEKDHLLAQRVALEMGYEPRSPEYRALYYFLTDQWQRYEALDFDRFQLLRAVYESSTAELRRRIIRKVQQAGRTDFLTILVGSDYRSRAGEMSDAEIEPLVHILTTRQEWDKLWSLVFELSPQWSLQILRALPREGWRPVDVGAGHTCAQAILLAHNLPEGYAAEWEHLLPVAALEARVRVSGRINAVAFSPIEPLIAVATGNRKVVLWNYQQAAIQQTLAGFAHSVGQVAFLPDGSLFCGERTNSDEPCSVYYWDGAVCHKLGSHSGSVTCLEPAGQRLAISTGRDHQVILWDLTIRDKIASAHIAQWPRQACVSAGGDRLVLLDTSIREYGLPQLGEIARSVPTRRYANGDGQMSRCAAFIEPGEAILVGKQAGAVLCYRPKNYRLIAERTAFRVHSSPVQGIEFLADRDLVISADATGEVAFTTWSTRATIGSVHAPGERLTSLSVSTGGAFMATGDRDSSLALWDLRYRELPLLFDLPFCRYSPSQTATVFALAGKSNMPSPAKSVLEIMQIVLQSRTRFDIQIDTAPAIRAGEYDIFIE